MIEARNRVSAAATEQEQAKLKISHLEKRIKEDEPRAKKAKEQNSSLFKDLDVLKKQTQKLQAELNKLGYEEALEQQMKTQETASQRKIRDLKEQADKLRR